MNIEQIEKFLEPTNFSPQIVKVDFKSRNSISGIFLKARDYNDLKSKNFWRIVSEGNIETWNRTQNVNEARIYHGTEITKLSTPKKAKAEKAAKAEAVTS
jgi:hypothetical protein